MPPRLYLETTIPSYLVARPSRDLRIAADQEATQEWWDERRVDFDLFISETVLREVSKGNPEMAAARIASLHGVRVLPDTPLANRLAKHLLASGISRRWRRTTLRMWRSPPRTAWISCSHGTAHTSTTVQSNGESSVHAPILG